MRIVTKPKKWGNSLGIIIPKEVIKKEDITSDTEISIEIEKKNPLKEIFGTLKGWKLDAQKIKDEIREEEAIAEERKWGRKLTS